jgi:hypothetical protein
MVACLILMKRIGFVLIAVAACVLCVSSAKAALVVLNFDDSTFNPANTQNPTAYAGVVPYTFNQFSGFTAASLTARAGGNGATTSAGAGDGGGTGNASLQFTARVNGNPADKNVNSSTFVLTLTSSSQITSITITYNLFASQTDANVVNTWTLAGADTGNGNVTAVFTPLGAGQWDTATVTFTGIAISPGVAFTLTDTLSGYANNPGGSAQFDNISITAVPEPINCAMAIFGLAFAGGTAGRFYLGRRRSAAVS